MKMSCLLSQWLFRPALRGKQAALYSVIALGMPTVIRQGVDSAVSGLAYTFYFPFILFAAMLLRPLSAAALAAASVLIVDFLFLEPRFTLSMSKTTILGSAAFLIFSAIAILLAMGIRHELASPRVKSGKGWKGIVFSSSEGEALASWYDGPSHVPLGPETEVAEMMEDFLAQVEHGKRLNGDRPADETAMPKSASSR